LKGEVLRGDPVAAAEERRAAGGRAGPPHLRPNPSQILGNNRSLGSEL